MFKASTILAWSCLLQTLAAIYDIQKVADPTVSWSNIEFGSPILKIFFSAEINFNGNLKDFWLKISIPFYTNTLKAEWAIDNCSQILDFKPAVEERISVNKDYTEFYVQFLGAVFQKSTTYVLKIIPDPYMDYLGFSNPFKIAIVSQNVDNYLTYAYNNNFFHFVGTPPPGNDLVLKQLFKEDNCFIMSKQCSQSLKLKLSTSDSVYRIVVELTGSYLFDNFDEESCMFLVDSSINAKKIPKNYYSCYLTDAFGDFNRYLVFESTIVLKPSNYFIKFTTKTPEIIGSHSYRIFIMDKYSSKVVTYAEVKDQFTVNPFAWNTGYPLLKFSMGFNAADSTLPYYLGLYSTSSTYNQVLNSLRLTVKAKELPNLKPDEYLTVRVYLGLPNPIFPLGQIKDNFESFNGEEKIYQRTGDYFTIDKVLISPTNIYTISYKIGFLDSVDLNSSNDNGFGVVQILKNNNLVVSGRAAYKIGLNKVIDNKNIYIPESVNNLSPGYYRGYSAFRSAPSSQLLNNHLNYKLQPNRHGLRIGDNQEFFVQSSVGAISLYTTKVTLAKDHNSARSFLQVITHPSIRSKLPSFPDANAQTNCKFYSNIFSKWSNQFTITEAQTVLDPTQIVLITVPPASYNPISGCAYTKINYNTDEKISYSRFRMRFKDLSCQDQTAQLGSITGVKLAFPYSNSQLANIAQQNGNYFVFNSVDIVDPRSTAEFNTDFYVLDAFFHLYYYSNLFQTEQSISSVPSVLMMDNLYILADTSTAFVSAASLNFFVQNMYYTVNTGVRTLNNNSQFSAVMQIYGKFTNLSPDTAKIKIFFEGMEPLPVNSDSLKVDCRTRGLKAESCRLEYGVSGMQEVVYRDVTLQNSKILYLNSKMTSSIVIAVDKTSIVDANNSFVLTFPIQLLNSANFEKYLLTSADIMPAFPSFTFFDTQGNLIQQTEYGSLGTFFNIYSYHTNYLLPSLTSLSAGQIATIYDVIPANEPAFYAKFVYPNNQAGMNGDLTYSLFGAGFKNIGTTPSDFTSVTFCSDFNFIANTTFSATGPSGLPNFSNCERFVYLDRYCFYCSDVKSPSSTYTVTNIIMPNTNGLLWPTNSVSVISNKYPFMVLDHSLAISTFNPNVLTIVTDKSVVPQSGLSFKLDLSFRLANNLQKFYYVILQTATGDFRLTLKGDNSKPMCKIYQAARQIECFFQISLQSIRIQTYEELKSNDLVNIELFGLSSEGPDTPTDLKLEIFTAKDDSLSLSTKIDSSLPNYMTISYNPLTVTGSLSIADITIMQNFGHILTDVSMTFLLTDRLVYPNDAIYIDLGCEGLNSNSKILLLESQTERIITQISSIEYISNKELLIQNMNDFTQKTFILKIWGFNMTDSSDSSILSQYTFNYGYLAFKSPKVGYPLQKEVPESSGFAVIKDSGAGFKAGIEFSIKPKITIKETDTIYLRFFADYAPNLSNFPLYVYENNYGYNKLNVWYFSPNIIGVNGFKNEFDAGRYFKFLIMGLQLFDWETKIWIIIAPESGIQDAKEKVLITVPPAIQSQYIDEIFVRNLLFSPRTLRMLGKIGFRMTINKPLSRGQSLILKFDHLVQEVLKPVAPLCSLYQIKKSKFTNYTESLSMDPKLVQNITQNFTSQLSLKDDIFVKQYAVNSCKMSGNNLEINIGDDMDTEIIVVADGIPTPDMKSCRFSQPSIVITNAKNTKILMSSSPITSNAQRTTFENFKTLTSLSFSNSQLEITRGFYEVISVSIDLSPDNSRLFKKKISFVLINNENGSFISQNYNPKNGLLSQSKVNNTSVDIIIGAQDTTSLFDYSLIITKQELLPIIYTDLPVLTAKVIANSISLIVPTQPILVYRGGNSLPIIIRSPKYPINEEFFRLKITGNAASDIKVKNEVDEFSFSFSNTVFMITLEGLSNTNFDNAVLEIIPINIALFNPVRISLFVVASDSRENNFNVTITGVQETAVEVNFISNNQVYVCFYVIPESSFVALSQSYVETMVKIGAYTRNGIYFVIDTLINTSDSLRVPIQNLTPGTAYIAQGYYTISSSNIRGTYSEKFTTKSKEVLVTTTE
jgi:hypothetical protein